ncbi:MAG: hypothetical protein Tsb0016_16970 [Sphingomonadales bacterium]
MRFIARGFVIGVIAAIAGLCSVGNDVHAADKEIATAGPFTILVNERRQCAQVVGLAFLAADDGAYEDDAAMAVAVAAARQALGGKCQSLKAFSITGYAARKPVYRASASAGEDWQVSGYWVGQAGRKKNEEKQAAQRRAAGAPASAKDYLDHYAYVEAPAENANICGTFALRQPLRGPDAPVTSLAQVVNGLSGGDPEAYIFQHQKIFNDIATQRNRFNNRCAASVKLGRDALCSDKDFDCAVLTACMGHLNPAATDAQRAYFGQCIENQTHRIAQERQKTYAARFMVEGEEVRVILGKVVGADDRLGDWCGEHLWGRIEYPREFNVLPALAKTTAAIVNESLSAQCAAAKTVTFALARFSSKFSSRQARHEVNYLQAFRDDDVWHVNLHPDYIQQLRAQQNLSALWAMVSNPSSLGYAMSMARYNEASAMAAQSRYARYAREGKVCQMRDAVRHCYVSTSWTAGYGGSIGRTMIITHTPTYWSSCSDPCKNHRGYCNMETGARYGTAEAAERANCRPASQTEIDAAIDAVSVDTAIPAYRYALLYWPYDQFPPQGQ